MPHQFLCLCCERYFDTERGLTCHRRWSQFCRGQGTKRKFGTLSENAVPDSTHDTLISEGQEYLLPETDAQSSTSAAPEDGSFYSNLSDSSSSADTEDSEGTGTEPEFIFSKGNWDQTWEQACGKPAGRPLIPYPYVSPAPVSWYPFISLYELDFARQMIVPGITQSWLDEYLKGEMGQERARNTRFSSAR